MKKPSIQKPIETAQGSFCVQGIEKKLKEVEGVEAVKVDLETKKVTVNVKIGSKLTDEIVENAIKDSGYRVIEIERIK
jgi:copper chaperone CopZ